MTAVIGGYQPGALGWVVERHARTYAVMAGFGAFFEAKVARELAEFLPRRDEPGCGFFLATEGDALLGSASIDWTASARSAGAPALFRWFIVAEDAQGRGLGRRLLETALDRARAAGAPGVTLHTFAGLDAARALYEAAGFRLVHETPAESWGTTVREQRFDLAFPSPTP